MTNRVSEQFETINADFGRRAEFLLRGACERVGFEPKEEIWRGFVYQRKRVGSVIARGVYQGKPAVLKMQGLRPEIEEAELIARFSAQNQSKRIRTPLVYYAEPWGGAWRYGLTIMEDVTAPPLFAPPCASEADRAMFVDFYAEFCEHAVDEPFVERGEREKDTETFLRTRLASWKKLNAAAEVGRRLPEIVQRELVAGFEACIDRYADDVPMVFTHGHLGPDDIRIEAPGTYVLFSNFFWGWRPLWYDLAFNVWCNLMALWKIEPLRFADAEQIVSEWFAVYETLPMARSDHHFHKHFMFMMLERCVGPCLVDLVIAERGPEAEEKRTAQLEVVRVLARVITTELLLPSRPRTFADEASL